MSSIWTPGGERPVPPKPATSEPTPPPRSEDAAQADPRDELTPEQQAQLERELAAMQEEVASTPASVVVANHAVGLFQLAAIHLNQQPPNLAEGRLAIDAMAALVEGLAGRLGDEEQSLRDGLAQLRMAFVQLSAAGGTPPA
ncbi:MAG: DUF1844 domain-containing protein [Actinobacteria bacterium]|nr:DUF1844 domain-containing protein [Actinomycetota bacterium]MBW3641376.1 DUF1844 domain-containing protein [Actinomycetota bacterium]